MSSSDISRQILEMPVIGRNFDLDTVYDAISDATESTFYSWKEIGLTNIKTTRNEETKFSIIASDRLTDKLEVLQLSGSLQVSILCDMFEKGGKGRNYLLKNRNFFTRQSSVFTRQSSVCVKIQSLSAIKELIDYGDLNYRQIEHFWWINKGLWITSATHVAIKIQYGTEATFKFSKDLSETDDEKQVNKKLKLYAENFIKCFKVNDNVGEDAEVTSQAIEDEIKCSFQYDFNYLNYAKFGCHPTTYKEAIEFTKDFIKILREIMRKDPQDVNMPLGKPLTVWLSPLVLMQGAPDTRALKNEISLTLASKCVQIMQTYEDAEDRVFYILEDPELHKLSPFKKKLKDFQHYLTSFLNKLKLKLREIVIDIRSGNTSEDSFEQLLEMINDKRFPFNPNRLYDWTKKKSKELCTMKKLIDEAENQIGNNSNVLFFSSFDRLVKKTISLRVETVFEFTFFSFARKENFFEQLKLTLRNKDMFSQFPTATNNSNEFNWWEDKDVIQRIQREFKIFVELVKKKSGKEKYAFAVTAHEKYNIEEYEFSIVIHRTQHKIFGKDAVLRLFYYYPKEKLFDVASLLIEQEINEYWNPFPWVHLKTLNKFKLNRSTK